MKQFQAPTAQDMVRFLSKIRFAGQDECWMWMGTLSRKGYPEFSLGGRPRRATQIAMEWLGGIDMGDGGHALHRCDRPPCVNPTHLFRGDNVANNADRDAKGRTRKGERHAGSVVSDDAITLMFERKSAGWKLRAIAEEAAPIHLHERRSNGRRPRFSLGTQSRRRPKSLDERGLESDLRQSPRRWAGPSGACTQ
jgi:hypothetical protein